MNWFDGEISEAVKRTIEGKKVFIVFVKDVSSPESHSLEEIWKNEEVFCLCTKESTISIQVEVDSVTGKQFANIYPILCVPCTYLINNEGLPVDIIPGALNLVDFKTRLSEGIQKTLAAMHLDKTDVTSENNEKAENITKEQEPLLEEPVPRDTVQDEAKLTEIKASSSLNNQTNEEFTVKEKAKRLLERSNKLKQEKEKQDLKEKERKRLQEGQELTLAKRDIAERQARQLADEIAKRKTEEAAARELVRAQLKQDKLEKAARFEAERKARLGVRKETTKVNTPAAAKSDRESTRIQFRLPDGSTLSNVFPSNAMFLVVHNFISERMRDSYPRIRLTTVFPKHEFVSSDMDKTLRDLALVPHATIMVSPERKESSPSSSLSPSSIVSLLFAPIVLLYTWILSLFTSTVTNSNASATNVNTGSESTTATRGSDVRRRGNIRQLQRNDGDSDDENKTWNGNSTQQM